MKLYPLLGVTAWWLLSALSATAANPPHVLILNPHGRDVEPFSSTIAAFRLTLAREMGSPVGFYEPPFELARFDGGEEEVALVAFLEDRIRKHPVDLVVPFGTAGGQFVTRHQQRLFPITPILLTAAEPRFIPPEFLQHNALEAEGPRYDWRELRRWGIKETNLPAGSTVEFRQPGFWQQYGWLAAGTLVLGSLQAALIFGLLASRSKRRRSEAEATLIADISSKFVNLPPQEVDREILDAQRRLCGFFDIDLSALWQWEDRKTGFFTTTHLYSLQHGPQPPMELSADDFPWCCQQMQANRVAAHRSLAEMPAEAAKDRETALRFGIKSHLTLPLSVGGGPPVGFLGFNSMRAERSWPDPLVKRMQLVAQVFANALARKCADHALRESEMRLSLATESAGEGLWVLDWETQTFWISPKAREIFGYLPEEDIEMAEFHQSVHPDDWERVEQSIGRAVKEGELVDVEYRIQVTNGSWRWVVSRGRPLFRASGEPDRLVGLTMDITERRKAEETLHQLSLAVEQSPDLVMITDLQGRIIYVNRKFSEVTGYSSEECLGRNPGMLKSGECPPSVYREVGKHHQRKNLARRVPQSQEEWRTLLGAGQYFPFAGCQWEGHSLRSGQR